LLFDGVVRLSVPDPVHGGCGEAPQRPISRCSMSKVCVVEPGRISTADEMADELV
jgi:hypothetical protein